MAVLIENAVFNIPAALQAQAGGADRIELCDNPAEGGTTPSAGVIDVVRRKINIDVFVMIRPRGGDFVYSADEYSAMKSDIMACKRAGIDGVVLGILNPDGRIDVERCRELILLAKPMAVTLHRAFDLTPDPEAALMDAIAAGFDRILTSGRAESAELGTDLLKRLVKLAGNSISILAGVGINAGNARNIVEQTGVKEIHFSARTWLERNDPVHNAGISLLENLPSDTGYYVADPGKIRAVREALDHK
jgi:copper homeostasis protein